MKYLDRVLQRWRIHKVVSHIPPNSRVLDIGSADGALFRSMRDCRAYLGIDPLTETRISIGPRGELRGGWFPDSLTDETFDVICMLAVLEHVRPEDQPRLAAGCAKHLAPGGKLLLTVPSPRVDVILTALSAVHLLDGMSLEQHYGFDVERTRAIFEGKSFSFVGRHRFQLGLNNLFVFQKHGNESQ